MNTKIKLKELCIIFYYVNILFAFAPETLLVVMFSDFKTPI